MPKNIVFCADGTWNGPNSKDDDKPSSLAAAPDDEPATPEQHDDAISRPRG